MSHKGELGLMFLRNVFISFECFVGFFNRLQEQLLFYVLGQSKKPLTDVSRLMFLRVGIFLVKNLVGKQCSLLHCSTRHCRKELPVLRCLNTAKLAEGTAIGMSKLYCTDWSCTCDV